MNANPVGAVTPAGRADWVFPTPGSAPLLNVEPVYVAVPDPLCFATVQLPSL